MDLLHEQLNLFRSGSDLDEASPESFLDALIASTDEGLLADLFIAWNEKGTSENEIYSLAKIMRARAVRVVSKHSTFVDAVGTGGSKAKTFNISTAAAFVAAGTGVPVAKHGNKAATSNSGSADVLSALGVNPAVDAATAEACLNSIGICFMFAPNFHRLSPVLGKVRRGLGFPTIFNNLGPLCNPANAPHHIIGVWHKDLVEKTANVLARLGTRKSWVVNGKDGLDEITLNGKTHVAEIVGASVKIFEIKPADFGLTESSLESLKRCSPDESAEMIRSILSGESENPIAINLVLINAAATIYLAGRGETVAKAFEIAKTSLAAGESLAKLNDLIEATNK